MLAKVFARTVKASFHRGDTGGENLGNFCVAAPFLHQCKQRTILRAQLSQGVAESVQLLGIHRAGRLGNIFVLLAKRQENPAQLLAAQLIDAGVAREPKQPRLELRRRLQTIQRSDHFDEHLLRQVFDIIASSRHGVNKSRDPMLVGDNELPLGVFLALLSPPHKVGQRSR